MQKWLHGVLCAFSAVLLGFLIGGAAFVFAVDEVYEYSNGTAEGALAPWYLQMNFLWTAAAILVFAIAYSASKPQIELR